MSPLREVDPPGGEATSASTERRSRFGGPGSLRRLFHWKLKVLGTGALIAGFVYAGVVIEVLRHTRGTAVFPVDCAIVFGAAVHPLFDDEGKLIGSQAGPAIRRRVAAAVALYEQGKVGKIYVTGGKGDAYKRSEATIMAREAVEMGVDGRDVILEANSSNTRENLLNTLPLMTNCRSLVGISDGYHLARIEQLARQQGVELPTYPATADPPFLFLHRSVLREAAGILWYAFME